MPIDSPAPAPARSALRPPSRSAPNRERLLQRGRSNAQMSAAGALWAKVVPAEETLEQDEIILMLGVVEMILAMPLGSATYSVSSQR